ncbi:MAG: tRNA pseudouridine(55) synthase TruB [Firmicutes bacterium]|nr:tRNA pseudouridine(55) synthase TruB [Bacillota bacterium]
MNGVLIIDKQKGITSRDVVNNVVKKFNTKKVGHTGTLDPIATGVLVVCVGSATKLVDKLTCNDKEYIASVELGTLTDTLDNTGKILNEETCVKTKEEIIKVLNSFKGKYLQEVPIYSAVKINGKKLYEYARENIEVELPKREVEITDIELIDNIEYKDDKTLFKFKCSVSKGTYIRSLIRDIALKLNTIGIMTDLRRVRQGKFKIEDSICLEELNENNLVPIIDVLDYKKIELTSNKEKEILNGAIIDNIYDSDEVLFISGNEAVALYKKYDKDNKKLKPYKMFKGGR